jgi:hypothetical protein
MYRFLRSLLLIVLLPVFCKTQDDVGGPTTKQNYKGFLMFSLGTAIPKSDLALQVASNDKAGLAKPGLDIRLSGGCLLSKNVGIYFSYFGQGFKLNAQVMADYFASQLPGTTCTVQITRGWGLGGLLGGFYARLPLGESETFALEPRVMFGFATGQSPDFSLTAKSVYPGGGQSTVRQYNASSQVVGAYILGCSFKIETSKRFMIGLNVDYTPYRYNRI